MNEIAVALVFVHLIVEVPAEKVMPDDPTVQLFALVMTKVPLPITSERVRPEVDVRPPESVTP